MNEAMFADLLESVRDAGRVLRGEVVEGVKITRKSKCRTSRRCVKLRMSRRPNSRGSSGFPGARRRTGSKKGHASV